MPRQARSRDVKPPTMRRDELRLLIRLIRKYGPKHITDAIRKIPAEALKRGRGRPRIDNDELDSPWSVAWQIELLADQHRSKGSHKPYKDAYLDLYENLYGHRVSSERDFTKFYEATRKRHRQENPPSWRPSPPYPGQLLPIGGVPDKRGGPDAPASLVPLSPTIASRDLGQPRRRGWTQNAALPLSIRSWCSKPSIPPACLARPTSLPTARARFIARKDRNWIRRPRLIARPERPWHAAEP